MKAAREVKKKQGMVSAMFHNREHVLEAYQALVERGYAANEVKLLMSPESLHSDFGAALDFSGNGFFDYPSSMAPAHNSIKEITSLDSITDAGLSPDRALMYTSDISGGAIVIAVMPKGPTDRYMIGQYWRKAHGENILGDDEDF